MREKTDGVNRQNIIMVADDDFYMRELVKLALCDLSIVVEADSGDKVLELYKQHNPDVLLLDIHMPKINGKQLLRDILWYDPNAYVVMLSADGIPENVLEANNVGAQGFVVKPFTRDALLKYVLPCPTVNFHDGSL